MGGGQVFPTDVGRQPEEMGSVIVQLIDHQAAILAMGQQDAILQLLNEGVPAPLWFAGLPGPGDVDGDAMKGHRRSLLAYEAQRCSDRECDIDVVDEADRARLLEFFYPSLDSGSVSGL